MKIFDISAERKYVNQGIRLMWIYGALFFLSLGITYAQGGSSEYKDGMTVKLDSTGKKYIRFFTWGTFWARYTKANPGTAINGIEKSNWTDFSIRQFRFLTYSQLSPRYLILADIGIDNQSFSSGGSAGGGNTGNGGDSFNGTLGKKPIIYLHELWNEFTVIPDKNLSNGKKNGISVYIGTGLHYWMGISRMSTSSSANYLALDVPVFNWPLVDVSDQFGRQLGVYLKGNISRLSYRWAINKPFTVKNPVTEFPSGSEEYANAVDNNEEGNLSTTGYASWQFLERENNMLPYTTGTYVGTKKVLNLGAGYYHQRNGTTTQENNTSKSALINHDINIFALDIFADIPFGNSDQNWAVTAYSVYYNYNFGPKYLRNGSIMNENVASATGYSGPVSQAGFGNLAPLIGTGNIWFTQAGLLLPKNLIKPGTVRFQLFSEFSLQKFKRFDNAPLTYYSFGSNFFLDGHHSKISLKYQSRPIVTGNRQVNSKGTYIISTQVYL